MSAFIRKFWTHIFVVATGFAALSHSTWTLATIFGGPEPLQIGLVWLLWVIPGFLIAFAFDIGQIAISVELRDGERTRAKYIAFAVLAVSTYFLQWWHLAHHIPALILAEGLRPDWRPFASVVSDAIVWVGPALLPMATTLYTGSYAKPKRIAQSSNRIATYAKPANNGANHANAEQVAKLPLRQLAALPQPAEMTAMFIAECPNCDWKSPCETDRQRINRLNAHKRFCKANVEVKELPNE